MRYRVVLYNLNNPTVKVVVANNITQYDASVIRSRFRKGGWNVERRYELDTLGDIVLATVPDVEDSDEH